MFIAELLIIINHFQTDLHFNQSHQLLFAEQKWRPESLQAWPQVIKQT